MLYTQLSVEYLHWQRLEQGMLTLAHWQNKLNWQPCSKFYKFSWSITNWVKHLYFYRSLILFLLINITMWEIFISSNCHCLNIGVKRLIWNKLSFVSNSHYFYYISFSYMNAKIFTDWGRYKDIYTSNDEPTIKYYGKIQDQARFPSEMKRYWWTRLERGSTMIWTSYYEKVRRVFIPELFSQIYIKVTTRYPWVAILNQFPWRYLDWCHRRVLAYR